MSDEDVTKLNFDQLWLEMERLGDAWHDRHDLSGRGIAALFLQFGTTCAYLAEVDLEDVLGLVREQWSFTQKEKP